MAPDDIRTQLALLAISVHEEATVSETVDRVLEGRVLQLGHGTCGRLEPEPGFGGLV